MGELDLASLCAGYGLKSAIGGHQLITTLSISLVWIIYSAIPPLLLVVYRFLGRGSFLSWLCWLCFLVSSACGFLAILLLWNVYPAEVRIRLRLPQMPYLDKSCLVSSLVGRAGV